MLRLLAWPNLCFSWLVLARKRVVICCIRWCGPVALDCSDATAASALVMDYEPFSFFLGLLRAWSVAADGGSSLNWFCRRKRVVSIIIFYFFISTHNLLVVWHAREEVQQLVVWYRVGAQDAPWELHEAPEEQQPTQWHKVQHEDGTQQQHYRQPGKFGDGKVECAGGKRG